MVNLFDLLFLYILCLPIGSIIDEFCILPYLQIFLYPIHTQKCIKTIHSTAKMYSLTDMLRIVVVCDKICKQVVTRKVCKYRKYCVCNTQ